MGYSRGNWICRRRGYSRVVGFVGLRLTSSASSSSLPLACSSRFTPLPAAPPCGCAALMPAEAPLWPYRASTFSRIPISSPVHVLRPPSPMAGLLERPLLRLTVPSPSIPRRCPTHPQGPSPQPPAQSPPHVVRSQCRHRAVARPSSRLQWGRITSADA